VQIAMVLPSLSRSATITVAFNIASGLIATGHSVDIFYFDDLVERQIPVGCKSFKICFLQKIDFAKYDVIHSHNLRPDIYLAINRRHIRGVCVSTIHNYVKEEIRNYHGKLASLIFTQIWKIVWQRLDCLVCLTKDASEYYQKLLPLSCISYVYNGVSIFNGSAIVPESAVINAIDYLKNSGLFVLGTYCNQTKGKGLEQIVNLVYADPCVSAIIIGDGPENSFLVSLAKKLGVEDRCLFFSFLPNAYIYNQYFDAYIIPSRIEGFGVALVEASLSDVNIMCSDITVFREMFNESEVSFFKLDDIEGMLKIVDQFKAGLDKRGLAKHKAQKVFSIGAMTESYIDIYRRAFERLQ